MPKKTKHIHRYTRVKLGKDYIVYTCNLPDCAHYIPISLVSGKLCLCNKCGEQMFMSKRAMTLKKPHCSGCTKRKDEDVIGVLEEIL